ncbi:tRNA-splicing endonuclease subunit Sen54-like [Lineus longissimus]|uniref:tRNA-splicing endonuclease subunit Sen54-like n=1 Tax=Lineus longissimus TaxID=88925 RepID=UPI002B4E6FFA
MAFPINALSSGEISVYRKPKNKELPSRGFKEYAPDGSWVQEKRLEKALANTREVLSEAKVNLCGSLVTGLWLPDQSLVEVVKGKGLFWQYMGHSEMKKDYLFPEEALFLLDSGTMEVLYGGMPLSIQQAYARLLCDLTIAEYQVYAHLMRQGYIVSRYRPGSDIKITKYEKKIGLDHHISKKLRKQQRNETIGKIITEDGTCRKRTSAAAGSEECVGARKRPRDGDGLKFSSRCVEGGMAKSDSLVVEGVQLLSGTSCSMEGGQGRSDTSCPMEVGQKISETSCPIDDRVTGHVAIWTSSEVSEIGADLSSSEKNNLSQDPARKGSSDLIKNVCDDSDITNVCESRDTSAIDVPDFEDPALLVNDSRNSKEWSEKLPYTNWNFADFAFLSISERDSEFDKPDPSLLPRNVDLKNSSFHSQRFSLPAQRFNNPSCDTDTELEFSCGDIWNRSKPKTSSARNWCEYKQELLKVTEEEDDLQKTPISHLWEGDVTPLLQPHGAKSTALTLEKLQVVQSRSWDSNEKLSSDIPAEELRVTFNLYSPDIKTSYRKSTPPLPNYRVCVLRQSASPPDLAMITHVVKQTRDDVPILWAVSDYGDIQFFTFSPVEMPVDVNIG